MEVHLPDKSCVTCKESKPISDFYSSRGVLFACCKKCDNKRRTIAAGSKPRRPKIPADEMRAKRAAYSTRWCKENRERHAAYKKERARRPDINLALRISRAMRRYLKAGKGGLSSEEIIGYTMADLRLHIGRQFVKGMGWDNMGKWHIDHIVPLSAFAVGGPRDPNVRRAWALTNLRPIWAEENLKKGGKRTFLL